MRLRRRLLITGRVQGVGFRPFVWRLARRHRLAGWVENVGGGVLVEVEGMPQAVASFQAAILQAPPPHASIDRIIEESSSEAPEEAGRPPLSVFTILAARPEAAAADTNVPHDLAPCEACLRELRDERDRRHAYPFITCTDCGPRFTIITSLPYDRPRTTMASFPLCDACRREYEDPANRRFHAEPIACPTCGPTVWLTAADEPKAMATERPADTPPAATTLTAARRVLHDGGILAIKGIGGFHLVCDATNVEAVRRLRARKDRGRKPLAVMVADLADARRIAVVDEQATRLLVDPTRPIVLLPKRPHDHLPDGSVLADEVAPDNGFVGLMLPSSPLHELLVQPADTDGTRLPPLVVTSGNLADEPIAHENADAASRLATLADAFLMHDRPIHVPCDDSVVRCVAGMPLAIRLGRGHAPQMIPLADDGPCVLALGGELKATLCLAHGHQAVISQHLGDIGNPLSLEALEKTAAHLCRLTGAEPQRIVADLHPGYLSTSLARQLASRRGIPLVQVQHHEAHAAALLAEHGFSLHSSPPVLVACFDGTGYGRDGTLQGGEFLLAGRGRLERVACLEPFQLPGGEAAIREPWRAAVGLLHAMAVAGRLPWPPDCLPARREVIDAVARQAASRRLCQTTTSMGRLFDAVASLTGLCHAISYEAEAAMRLEAAAASCHASVREPRMAFELPPADTPWPWSIRWDGLIASLLDHVALGTAPQTIAASFHEAIAAMIVAVARQVARTEAHATGVDDGTTILRVGLTGGVFQNALLCERTIDRLSAAGQEPLLPAVLPPNDGGLSLGQAVLGRQ